MSNLVNIYEQSGPEQPLGVPSFSHFCLVINLRNACGITIEGLTNVKNDIVLKVR